MRRDTRLDALRGLMLVLMMIFHWPGPLRRYTHEPVGFVSAAEGFVFLSGLIAGLVFSRLYMRLGFAGLKGRGLRRARDIYLYHIIPFILVWVIAIVAPATEASWGSAIHDVYQAPWMTLLSGSLLLYQPRFFDILPMYIIFVLFMPLVIQLLAAGRWRAVLLISAGLWGISQLGVWRELESLLGKILPVNLGTFDPFAWQMLFVWGLALGYWRLSYRGPSIFTRRGPVVVVAGVAGLLLLVRYRFLPPGAPVYYDSPLVDITTLAPLRLVNFVVLAYLVGFVAVQFRTLLSCRWLAFLGQHSLQVFTFHLAVVYAFMPLFGSIEMQPAIVQVLITLLALASLSVPAWLHQIYRQGKWGLRRSGRSRHSAASVARQDNK